MFSVPNPCEKKWNEMTPAAGGNFCNACQKVVVDLTKCSNEEILGMLRKNGSERMCGRLRFSQLTQPKPKKRLARFFAAIVVIFSFGLFTSCGQKEQEHEIMGDVAPVNDSLHPKNSGVDTTANGDTIRMETPFKLSKADSARVADSVEKTKNHVRDFQ
ncbi:MAG TPA: hypothetical protein VL651_05650 [Bacteroidia bacterium]|jgi:hypothetical protein|nr:hypothetical protein [Bacteroidia bacterium]